MKHSSIPSNDHRLYSDFEHLVALQNKADFIRLFPNLIAKNPLSGRHYSLFRGRGLNFEELKQYQIGDDTRHLDWKVTMRTGKPHVRHYSEEKDRHILLCVDQRTSMFFSSVDTMKSVVAAEIASICAWCAIKDNDRVGFSIATPNQIIQCEQQRTSNGLLAHLSQLSHINQSLNVHSSNNTGVSFKHWLDSLLQLRTRNMTIVVISDWHDCGELEINKLIQLQRSNDVLAIIVNDPMEASLPLAMATNQWAMSNGDHQFTAHKHSQLKRINHSLQSRHASQRRHIEKLMAIQNLPYLEFSTDGQHINQFLMAAGGKHGTTCDA